MNLLFKKYVLTPFHVSLMSFILMGLIVFGVGFLGAAYMIDYVDDQLTSHEADHNKSIASELTLKFSPTFKADIKNPNSHLMHAFEDYRRFGFKFFILDQINQEIIFDSEQKLTTALPINESWLSETTTLIGEKNPSLKDGTKILGYDKNGHVVLIWLQKFSMDDSPRWVLGVAKDQDARVKAMQELHLDLDTIMFVIFILITLLGYFAIRSTGRIYEQRLEHQLEERTKQLNVAHANVMQESKLATIGKTATVLAHEMRNPLASIKLALSSLNGSVDLKGREKKRVNLVLGEVDRLNDLLSKTLDFAKPVELSKKPVDLDLLLSQVFQHEEPLIKQKEITIRHKSCADCAAMCVDKEQFYQVLLNLVKNAVEACPKGGVIEATLQRKDNKLLFEISNSGDELSEEILQSAFEPFFTTKSKGTGLGLGLVKRVVDAHGGTIMLENNHNSGVKVRLTLPMDLV